MKLNCGKKDNKQVKVQSQSSHLLSPMANAQKHQSAMTKQAK